MNNYPEQTEQISNYQDEVVTLRQDVPKLYKGFLMKECQVVANKLVRSYFVPLRICYRSYILIMFLGRC